MDDGLTSALQDADTIALNLQAGDHVCCLLGDLKGIIGVVVEVRAEGRVLLRIGQGVYVELPRICVEKIRPKVGP